MLPEDRPAWEAFWALHPRRFQGGAIPFSEIVAFAAIAGYGPGDDRGELAEVVAALDARWMESHDGDDA